MKSYTKWAAPVTDGNRTATLCQPNVLVPMREMAKRGDRSWSDETVAQPAFGENVAGVVNVVAQLLPQASDVHLKHKHAITANFNNL